MISQKPSKCWLRFNTVLLSFLLSLLGLGSSAQTVSINKNFNVLPDDFSQVKSIVVKKVDTLKLVEIIKKCPDLEILDVSSSKLSVIPPEVCKLNKLRELKLGNNDISEIPSCLCRMENLKLIALWDNNVYKIPDCLREMPTLKILDLIGMEYNVQEQADLKLRFPNLRLILSEPCNCHFE